MLPCFLIILILRFLTSLLIGIQALNIKIFEHLILKILWSLIFFPWHKRNKLIYLLFGKLLSFGHNDVEFDEKIAVLGGGFEEGHAEAFYYFFCGIADYLALIGFYCVFGAVEMF